MATGGYNPLGTDDKNIPVTIPSSCATTTVVNPTTPTFVSSNTRTGLRGDTKTSPRMMARFDTPQGKHVSMKGLTSTPITPSSAYSFDEVEAFQRYKSIGSDLGLRAAQLTQFVTERVDTARLVYQQQAEARRQEDLRKEEMRQQEARFERQEKIRLEEARRQEEVRLEEARRLEKVRLEELDLRRQELERLEALRREELDQRRQEVQQNTSVFEQSMTAREPKERDDYRLVFPTLKEGDDIDFFLLHYENICKPRRWDDFKMVTRLVPLLSGKARKAYTDLTRTNANPSYKEVKLAILEEYRLTPEHYRRQFRTIAKNSDENFKQFQKRQELMLDRWFESGKVDRSDPNDVIRIVLLEQFMGILYGDLALHVREKEPKTAVQASELAFKHVEAKREVREDGKAHSHSVSKGSQGSKKKGVNRLSNDQQKEGNKANSGKGNFNKDEMKAKRAKHFDEQKKKLGEAEFDRLLKEKLCFKCKKSYGPQHKCSVVARIVSDSKSQETVSVQRVQKPSSPGTRGRDPLWTEMEPLCERCEQIQWRRDLKVRVNGKIVEAMRDTGADDLCVRPELVPESAYTGEKERIMLADMNVSGWYPRAVIHLDSPFVKGKVQCVVIADLGVDVFIGDSLRFEDGQVMDRVPVYPKKCLLAVTRAQAKADAKPQETTQTPQVDVQGINSAKLSELQMADESLSSAREAAKSGKKFRKNTVWYEIKKTILKRVYIDKRGQRFTQVCVPQSLRKSVMSLGHDVPMGGHMGAKKTKDRIWGNFYWPGMSADITRYCISCERCQKITPKGRVAKVPLEKMPIPDNPFDKVAVDLIGPFKPVSDAGFRYVLCMVDYTTRYPEAVPLKNVEAATVAEALWVMWTRLGIPKEIVSDNGGQFSGEIMVEVRKLLSIKGNFTTPYHAQANGLVERFNGTLKSMLRRLTGEKPRTWDKFIPALLFAYREVPQASTGFSPFELLYGRTVRGPLSVLKSLWAEDDVRDEETEVTTRYVFDLRNRIAETCQIAKDNLEIETGKHKHYFDKKAKRRTFPVGSRVLLLLPQKRNKLEMAWRGPYMIEERIGECDYKITIRGKTKVFHANMLKAFIERADNTKKVASVAVIDYTDSQDDEGLCDVLTTKEDIPLMSLKQTETTKDVHYGDAPAGLLKRLAESINRHTRILTDLPLRTTLEVCKIPVIHDKPVKRKQYPLPFAQREAIGKEVESMLKMGVITRSTSAYSSPIVLVHKPDGSYRFCTDLRELNRVVTFDSEPMPDVDYLFSKVAKAKFLSKFDCCKGYWQIEIAPEDRHKTAFATPQGNFEWLVMPFGLKTAGAVFTRMMNKLIQPLGAPEIVNFIDDVLVGTETEDRHVECVDKLLDRMDECNLAVKPSKCHVGYTQVEYLGHVVGQGEIKPMSDKLGKIKDAPIPTTKKQVRSFLGLAGYYRSFVPHFSEIAAPLTDATQKNKPNQVVWTAELQQSFRLLKEALSRDPICKLPDVSRPFVLRTDASDTGLGAVLLQDHEGLLRMVSCASKKLKGAELNYSTIEKECYAIVWGVKRFSPYLSGAKFVIQSDHQPLVFLQSMKANNKRLMRWALSLQPFDIRIEAIPGKLNCGADFLSRIDPIV